jgi:hypothetical protein
MADNLALKLLVAGIIGAVVGAALAERYHFPTGLVYGGANRSSAYPMFGSGRADEEEGSRVVLEPPDYYPPSPPRYLPAPRRPAPRTAWCWREVEDWNFRTTGHFVRCPAHRARDI